MRKCTIMALALAAAVAPGPGVAAGAEPPASPSLPAPEGYGGDLFTRSTLTGDWGGTRDQWAAKGITITPILTQVYQGVVDGSHDPSVVVQTQDKHWRYNGRFDVSLNFDTGKMGLWPGGFLLIRGEEQFGENENARTAALLAVNANSLFPQSGDHDFMVPHVQYLQFLSEQVGIIFGKLDTLAGDNNEFAHGKGDSGFLNLAFSANPVTILTTPYSALGGGFVVLPTKDLQVNVLAFDTEGTPDSAGFDSLTDRGTTLAAEARLTTHFFERTGHQTVGGTWSDHPYMALDQRLAPILRGLPARQASSSWCVYYNFDQYLYEPEKGKGVGLFGRFGASDGDANPIHYFVSGGVGGKGIVPGRPHDRFGVGYYYMDLSSGRMLDLARVGDEQGLEAYYECALTPWLRLTPDVQWINPSRAPYGNVVVLGLRLTMAF